MSEDLLEIADELYALALPDFTPSRDAKAKALKGTDLATTVKALRKPSTGAWVVNLLVRREAGQVGQLLEVGEALRAAQEGMSADDLRALTKQRRQLTAAVTQQARSLASEEGVRVTQAVADQVEATLTAAMVDADCGRALRSGLLLTTLSATGVDEVDVAAAVATPDALGFAATTRAAPDRSSGESDKPDLRLVPDPDAAEKARAEAIEQLEAADAELEHARGAHDEATSEVERLQARSLQVQGEIEELKRKVAELEASYDDVDDELGDAEDAQAEAQEALEEAQRARDEAASAVPPR